MENSLGNSVQSVLRARVRSTDPTDLKSAMKASTVERHESLSKQARQTSSTNGNSLMGTFEESCISGNSRDPSEEKALLDVEYRSTYPIDEPIESISRLVTSHARSAVPSLPQTNSSFDYHNHNKSKTFPVDKECCDINEPCEDHDDFDGDDDTIDNGTQDISSHFSGYENKVLFG